MSGAKDVEYLDLVWSISLPSGNMRDYKLLMSIQKGHLCEATSWQCGEAATWTWLLRDLIERLEDSELPIAHWNLVLEKIGTVNFLSTYR